MHGIVLGTGTHLRAGFTRKNCTDYHEASLKTVNHAFLVLDNPPNSKGLPREQEALAKN